MLFPEKYQYAAILAIWFHVRSPNEKVYLYISLALLLEMFKFDVWEKYWKLRSWHLCSAFANLSLWRARIKSSLPMVSAQVSRGNPFVFLANFTDSRGHQESTYLTVSTFLSVEVQSISLTPALSRCLRLDLEVHAECRRLEKEKPLWALKFHALRFPGHSALMNATGAAGHIQSGGVSGQCSR